MRTGGPFKGVGRDDFAMDSRNFGGPFGGVMAQYGPCGPRQAPQNNFLDKHMIYDGSVAHLGSVFGPFRTNHQNVN